MANQVKLKAQKRTAIGRNSVKKIKEQGLVPGIDLRLAGSTIESSSGQPRPVERAGPRIERARVGGA